MIFTTLLTNLSDRHSQIQIQIDELQAVQREIQAQMQKVGGVESKVESALALLQEAIADVRETCPDQLPEVKAAVIDLFRNGTVALLVGSDGIPATELTEPEPTEPEPTEPIDVVDAEVVEEIPDLDVEVVAFTEEEVVDRPITKEDLASESIGVLRALARFKVLPANGSKIQLIERILLTGITVSNFQAWKDSQKPVDAEFGNHSGAA